MPRENSFSDGDSGRSLTPDLEQDGFRVAPASSIAARGTSAPTSPTRSVRPAAAAAVAAGGAPAPQRPGAAKDRFKATVRKVMAMHRTSSVLAGNFGAGAEPGIDPRRASASAQYGHIRQDCVIEITDYSSSQHSFGRMSNQQFVQMLRDPRASQREPWAKVRWINIAGVSWDVVAALALRYDLHPLAVEDILHQPRGGLLSKVDYYTKHLFMRVLCHTLPKDGDNSDHDVLLYDNPLTNHSYTNLNGAAGVTGLPRSSSPTPFDEKGSGAGSASGSLPYNRKNSTRMTGMKQRSDILPMYSERATPGNSTLPPSPAVPPTKEQLKRMAEAQAIERLKHGERVNVHIAPMCIMLFRDGTVISITRTKSTGFTEPILARLKHRDTSLRNSPDGSFLVQALLDLIVDRVFEVVDEYQAKLIKLEHRVLLKPKMKVVRDLHILQADLSQHKRTLEPVKTVVYGLRRYDVDRVAALMSDEDRAKDIPVKGYMSHKAKIYLADVVDHMDYILTSLDMFAGTTENLINYTFNMASNEMNVVMKRLTLATIIFLPLTLLSGYFGMNFDHMWSVHRPDGYASDVLFWELAIPLVIVMVVGFMWTDFRDGIHYVKKRIDGRNDAQMMLAQKKRQ